jgi:hypothetical protein
MGLKPAAAALFANRWLKPTAIRNEDNNIERLEETKNNLSNND